MFAGEQARGVLRQKRQADGGAADLGEALDAMGDALREGLAERTRRQHRDQRRHAGGQHRLVIGRRLDPEPPFGAGRHLAPSSSRIDKA